MSRKIGLVFAACALFSIAGGHWAVLQSVAWAEMLHANALRSGSVVVAVERTFDGQHPCELCRQIQAAKAQEHKEAPATAAKKDDGKVKARLSDPIQPAWIPTCEEVCLATPRLANGPSRTDQPPTPPPRRVASAA